jgi:hypothetical protein
VTIGFEKDANGQYVLDEWLPYGMTLCAEGGIGSLPRIFDTSSPGTDKEGDLDLGAPNKACPGRGPGQGVGGEPGQPGMNCSPKGNALIIQEPGKSIPDDNVNGGIITLDYPFPNATTSRTLDSWMSIMAPISLSCMKVLQDTWNISLLYHFSGITLLKRLRLIKQMSSGSSLSWNEVVVSQM